MPRVIKSIASIVALAAVPLLAIGAAAAQPAGQITLPDGSRWDVWLTPATQPATHPATRPATLPSTNPATRPSLPPMTRRIAGPDPRGDGLRVPPATTSVRNLLVDGYEQNIVVSKHPLPTLFENVWSSNSHRPKQPWTFKGQGWYLEDCGPVTLRNVYSERAGWQPGKPWSDRDGYRHAIYSNFGVERLTIENAWLDDAACAAIQSRGGPCVIRDCLLTNNGIAILAVMGKVRVERCTIYGGHPYYQAGKPASWIGPVGLQAYWPVELDDVWFVADPRTADAVTAIAGLKTHHLGCIVTGGDYDAKDEWKPPKDAAGKRITKLITAKNCRIVGWPGKPFAGAAPHDGSGFIVGGQPVNVWPRLEEIRADLKASRIDAGEAAARGQAAVRLAAGIRGVQ